MSFLATAIMWILCPFPLLDSSATLCTNSRSHPRPITPLRVDTRYRPPPHNKREQGRAPHMRVDGAGRPPYTSSVRNAGSVTIKAYHSVPCRPPSPRLYYGLIMYTQVPCRPDISTHLCVCTPHHSHTKEKPVRGVNPTAGSSRGIP